MVAVVAVAYAVAVGSLYLLLLVAIDRKAQGSLTAPPHTPALAAHLTGLTELDLSFNGIRKVEELDDMAALTKLYLCSNKIKRVEGISHLTTLVRLFLASFFFFFFACLMIVLVIGAVCEERVKQGGQTAACIGDLAEIF